MKKRKRTDDKDEHKDRTVSSRCRRPAAPLISNPHVSGNDLPVYRRLLSAPLQHHQGGPCSLLGGSWDLVIKGFCTLIGVVIKI